MRIVGSTRCSVRTYCQSTRSPPPPLLLEDERREEGGEIRSETLSESSCSTPHHIHTPPHAPIPHVSILSSPPSPEWVEESDGELASSLLLGSMAKPEDGKAHDRPECDQKQKERPPKRRPQGARRRHAASENEECALSGARCCRLRLPAGAQARAKVRAACA